MPRFEPFRALRYRQDIALDDVIAPPYDVLSEADVQDLARSAHNIVHLDVPQGADRYLRAAALLQDWVREGVLQRDTEPSFTIYRMRFTDGGTVRDTAGVLGGLEVGGGGVLPHERTTAKDSADRLDLTRATRCNLSPVWGLSLASGLTALLQEPGEPLGELEVDGVLHRVERVSDPARVEAIAACVGGADVLIADGHHRYGVARTYLDEVRAQGNGGAAELTLAHVAELSAEQLTVEAIHRVYSDVDPADLRAALERRFELTEAPAPGPSTTTGLRERGPMLVTADGSWWLTPRPGAFDGLRALDGVWLEDALEGLAHTVTYQHGVERAAGLVQAPAVVAVVLIRPTSVEEIERTAREGLLMPPKSTFFTPKLRTGFVIRELAQD